MKRFKFLPFILSLCIVICAALPTASLALEDPDIQSRAAMVVDRSSGKAFYSLNADQLVYPASTTKIMTVLLAIEAIESESVSIYDQVTAPADMTYDLVDDGSTAGIKVGETMTLEDLLYCAMLSSANEACNVIAEYIGGTIGAFIQMMNDKAAALGCSNTHFANTHGLPDTNHYTTAADYSVIAREAAGHDLFMEICSTPSADIPATNMSGERHIKNSNALICADSMYGGKYLYEYASGIKTGFTSDAGYCLVSTASKGGIDLIAVVFGGRSYTDADGSLCYTNFEDSIKLYDWVFNNFSYQEVLSSTDSVGSVPVSMGADADSVNFRPESSLTALLPNDCDISSFDRDIKIYSLENGETLTAPISAGEVLGEIRVSSGGVDYGTVKLIASSSVDLSRAQYMKSQIRATLHSRPVVIGVCVLVLLAAIYLFLVIRYRVIHARRRKAAREAARARRAGQYVSAADAVPAPGRTVSRSVPVPSSGSSSPSDPAAKPNISYFVVPDAPSGSPDTPVSPAKATADSGAPAAPGGESGAPAQSSEPLSDESRRAKAERDYFEEFFRQK